MVSIHERADNISQRVDALEERLKGLSSRLDALDNGLKQMPNGSDYRLLASEIARLEAELERMDAKYREGMLALYTQIHKEVKSIKGDHIIELLDMEPVTKEKLEKASDTLSELAKTWRKRRAQPAPEQK